MSTNTGITTDMIHQNSLYIGKLEQISRKMQELKTRIYYFNNFLRLDKKIKYLEMNL